MTLKPTSAEGDQNPKERFVSLAFITFQRLLALVFLALTIFTWMQVIGYWDGPNQRFDTMSGPWKIYISLLAVLQPVASIGLWSTQAWGRVVWFLAIAVQIASLTTFSDHIDGNQRLVFFHLGCLAIYIIFLLAARIVPKKA